MATLILKDANCGNLDDWFKKQGRRYSYTTTPQPGDIVFYDWSGNHTKRDHTGIVKSVTATGIIAIEGNTSVGNDSNGGQVMIRERSKTYITSFGRPAYASTTERDRFLALAEAQVGTKESPANSNKVKYNTWFYGSAVSGSAYPWCAVFVCWVLLSGATATSAEPSDFSAYIKKFQTWLNTNYKTGLKVDGGYGPLTRTAAISAWQTECNTQLEAGLVVDGVYGTASKKAAKKCKVAYKASGNFTYLIQGLLYCHGYDPNGFDGTFGTGTRAAVINFQKAKLGSSDGVVGANTWAKLLSI